MLFNTILVWSVLRYAWLKIDWNKLPCKTQLLQTVAEWRYFHLVQWQKGIHISYTEKIHRITDCTHLLQQRRKTSDGQSKSLSLHRATVTDWRVEIGLHQCDIRRSWSRSWWKLLLSLASVTTGAACYMSGLWLVYISAKSAQHIHVWVKNTSPSFMTSTIHRFSKFFSLAHSLENLQ